MNTKQKIIGAAGLVTCLVVLAAFGFNVASALNIPGSFWDRAADRYADKLAEKTVVPNYRDNGLAFNDQSDKNVGAAGDTFSLQKLAQVIVTTGTPAGVGLDSASSTYGSLFNPTVANGGKTRFITRLDFVVASSTNTWLGGALIMDFGTSTSQYTSTTAPIASIAFATSSNPMRVSTTTGAVGNSWRFIWAPGEYLNCQTNRSISSTFGFCAAQYLTLD